MWPPWYAQTPFHGKMRTISPAAPFEATRAGNRQKMVGLNLGQCWPAPTNMRATMGPTWTMHWSILSPNWPNIGRVGSELAEFGPGRPTSTQKNVKTISIAMISVRVCQRRRGEAAMRLAARADSRFVGWSRRCALGRHLHMPGAWAPAVGRASHRTVGRALPCALHLGDEPLRPGRDFFHIWTRSQLVFLVKIEICRVRNAQVQTASWPRPHRHGRTIPTLKWLASSMS